MHKLLVSTLAITVLTFSACSAKEETNVNVKKADQADLSNQELEISYQIPETWYVIEDNQEGFDFKAAYYINLPDPDAAEAGQEIDIANLNLITSPVVEEISLEDRKVETESLFSEGNFLSMQEYEVDGTIGLKYVFVEADPELGNLQYAQYWFAHNGKEYLFTYSALPKNFDTHIQKVDEVVSSVKFNK